MTKEQMMEACARRLLSWAVTNHGARWNMVTVPEIIVESAVLLGSHEVAIIMATPPQQESADSSSHAADALSLATGAVNWPGTLLVPDEQASDLSSHDASPRDRVERGPIWTGMDVAQQNGQPSSEVKTAAGDPMLSLDPHVRKRLVDTHAHTGAKKTKLLRTAKKGTV